MIRFGLALAAIILAACTGPADVGNPPAIAVVGTPGLGAEGYALQRTSDAYQMRVLEATEQAGIVTTEAQRQADEIEAITRAAQVRADDRAFALTAAADVIVMTRESGDVTATTQAGIAIATTQAQATSTAEQAAANAYAIETTRTTMDIERRIDQYNRAERRADFVNAFVGAALICGTLLAMFLAWLRFRPQPKLIETPGGAWVLVPVGLLHQGIEERPLLPAGNVIEGDFSTNGSGIPDTLGRVPLMVNGEEREPITTKRDSNPERTNRVLVQQLLKEARDYADVHDGPRDVLPGYRNLAGFNPDMWTRATDVLARNRVIKKRARRATEFIEPWDIDTALMQTNLNRLDYAPVEAT